MLRYRAVELRKNKVPFAQRQLTETDRNGRLAALVPTVVNWAAGAKNKLTRPAMERALGVDARARLPKFHGKTFALRAKADQPPINAGAPGFGRKAVLYATCFVNYNGPEIGMAARAVLARNGVETVVAYPACCGMPQLEHGDIARVAANARKVAAELKPFIDGGYDVIALVPSCALMLKFEWPLILPDDADVKRLSGATFDISEYVVDIAKRDGLADGLKALDGGVSLHIACHARAQNMGQKAAEMLRLIPGADVNVIERCSGHGGSWGVAKENFEVAVKIGRPVARQAMNAAKAHLASECPLAADHIAQGVELLGGTPPRSEHPIQIFARAYGLA
jgi:glycerol-3-phosphate dehydrogenase subunit C